MTDRSNKDSKKSPVKIRFKAMKDGRRSIYLDCYRNGHRSYEYLKLYLVPETDDKSLRRNEATMRKAETACKKKLRTLSKILCKREQDSVISFFLYLDSVFKDKYKLVHNQSPV